jgi:protocatechuate 3,4-dioxygenase, beta subunit
MSIPYNIHLVPSQEINMPRETPSLRFVPERRRTLRALAAAVLLPAARAMGQPAALAPTPSQPEGPFYPKTIPADHDSDLTRIVGRAAQASGTPLYFSGRVLARDARPIVNARVELWQCDVHGRYHHAGDDTGPRDDNFQGYGLVTTDGDGRYAFKTIRPVPYSGRTPHLHVRVRPVGGEPLTTQIYIAGDSADGDFVLAGTPADARERLTMVLAPAAARESGALAGSFDFVIR